mmetsp:Transcript_16968/g.53478  ORF Transcript_16968/g.53478 Transcript_16968/m.53478 type:complete len:202 (-) Transcript_16968:91-696(-)
MAFVAASTRFDIKACGSVFCSGGRLIPKGACCMAAVVVVVTPAEICFACIAILATEEVSAELLDAVAARPAAASAAGVRPSSWSSVWKDTCRTTSPMRCTKSRPFCVCSVTSFVPKRYTPWPPFTMRARISAGMPSKASLRRRSMRLSTSGPAGGGGLICGGGGTMVGTAGRTSWRLGMPGMVMGGGTIIGGGAPGSMSCP